MNTISKKKSKPYSDSIYSEAASQDEDPIQDKLSEHKPLLQPNQNNQNSQSHLSLLRKVGRFFTELLRRSPPNSNVSTIIDHLNIMPYLHIHTQLQEALDRDLDTFLKSKGKVSTQAFRIRKVNEIQDQILIDYDLEQQSKIGQDDQEALKNNQEDF